MVGLTIAGAVFILAGVIANMHIYFRPTSLFNTLVMLVLFVGGLGLIARASPTHSERCLTRLPRILAVSAGLPLPPCSGVSRTHNLQFPKYRRQAILNALPVGTVSGSHGEPNHFK